MHNQKHESIDLCIEVNLHLHLQMHYQHNPRNRSQYKEEFRLVGSTTHGLAS